eukprot:3500395-Alexandrium_andersonii.AAC.1
MGGGSCKERSNAHVGARAGSTQGHMSGRVQGTLGHAVGHMLGRACREQGERRAGAHAESADST